MERSIGGWRLNLTGVYWLVLEVIHTILPRHLQIAWCWKPEKLLPSREQATLMAALCLQNSCTKQDFNKKHVGLVLWRRHLPKGEDTNLWETTGSLTTCKLAVMLLPSKSGQRRGGKEVSVSVCSWLANVFTTFQTKAKVRGPETGKKVCPMKGSGKKHQFKNSKHSKKWWLDLVFDLSHFTLAVNRALRAKGNPKPMR